jgi:PII-like signaling protein
MKGFQLEFFTQQDLFYHGRHLSEWLIDIARSHGIRGATVFMGDDGFGKDHRRHAAHMFDLTDHPVQVTMVVNAEECERLFSLLEKENLHLFFVKLPVEFGKVGE